MHHSNIMILHLIYVINPNKILDKFYHIKINRDKGDPGADGAPGADGDKGDR